MGEILGKGIEAHLEYGHECRGGVWVQWKRFSYLNLRMYLHYVSLYLLTSLPSQGRHLASGSQAFK